MVCSISISFLLEFSTRLLSLSHVILIPFVKPSVSSYSSKLRYHKFPSERYLLHNQQLKEFVHHRYAFFRLHVLHYASSHQSINQSISQIFNSLMVITVDIQFLSNINSYFRFHFIPPYLTCSSIYHFLMQ